MSDKAEPFECPDCGGSGKDADETDDCPTCSGTGSPGPTCSECDGDGWLPDPSDGGTMTCPACDGRGWEEE